jgi:UDP-N-acetylmuramoylalanine-D-glutamate ligase
VLNNIFPDHMNWHNNSFDIYKQAKENILTNSLNKIDVREIKNINKFETKLK